LRLEAGAVNTHGAAPELDTVPADRLIVALQRRGVALDEGQRAALHDMDSSLPRATGGSLFWRVVRHLKEHVATW
jgi:hypothetical protein